MGYSIMANRFSYRKVAINLRTAKRVPEKISGSLSKDTYPFILGYLPVYPRILGPLS